jgi:hypothetical protein
MQSSTWISVRAVGALTALCVLSAGGCTSSQPPREPSGDLDAGKRLEPASHPATTPSDTSSSPTESRPPSASGGQSGEGDVPAFEDCLAKIPRPDGRTAVATCSWQLGLSNSQRAYNCCCDRDRCDGPFWAPAGECSGDGDAGEEAGGVCVVSASSCAAAIDAQCGDGDDSDAGSALSIASCLGYSSLGLVACFQQPEGGYACDCPNRDAPVLSYVPTSVPAAFRSPEQDCRRVAGRACAGDCKSSAGRCSFDGQDTYRCECAYGQTVTQRASFYGGALCEDVLAKACEPRCANDHGACYGGDWSFACRCDADAELHFTPKSVAGQLVQDCSGQLTEFCGP